MMPFFQPVSPAVNNYLQEQFSLFTDLSKRIFDSTKKINDLNIQVAETIMEESLSGFQQILVANDPYEALSISAAQAQPVAEKMRAYQQHLTSIAAGTQVDLVKTAGSHVSETSRTAAAVADEVARQASEETEKVTLRQKAAMEQFVSPNNGSGRNAKQGRSQQKSVKH